MNLEDIAKKAGVSRSTVSRVINGEAYVSEKTRKRVLEIIEAEAFTPNLAARTLVTQRTQMIGIVIPDEFKDVFSNEIPYYYSALLQGISEATRPHDYATLLWIGHQDDAEEGYRRLLKNRWMDGLIIVASLKSEAMLVSSLLKNKTPFVLIGRPVKQEGQISYISVDNVTAAEQAVRHLLDAGRKRIGAIAGNADNADSLDRLAGYKRALRSAGMAIDRQLIVDGQFTRTCGYSGMKQLLEQRVDGVFAFSDMIALGALDAIREAGLRVPDDIAVVGFDDLPAAAQANPPLTTVRQPIAQKGARAASLLIERIEQGTSEPAHILLPTQLVIRESCP